MDKQGSGGQKLFFFLKFHSFLIHLPVAVIFFMLSSHYFSGNYRNLTPSVFVLLELNSIKLSSRAKLFRAKKNIFCQNCETQILTDFIYILNLEIYNLPP